MKISERAAQLYSHTLELAFVRDNGARAPLRPDADAVTQEAYSHEVAQG
jgi:hypothetical protein